MLFLFEHGDFLQRKYLEYLNIPEFLEKSFQDSGVLYPILYSKIQGFYFVIDGIKRLKFSIINGLDIKFKKIELANIKQVILLRKQISEYNLLEKIEILSHFKNSDLYSDLFNFLGFKKNINIDNFIMNFETLPQIISYAVANNKIKSKNIDVWSVFDINEIERILYLIEGLVFNVNQERQFLEYLLYIKVNICNLEKVFDKIKEIVSSKHTSTQKITLILEYLNNLCYPDYKKVIDKFYSLRKELNLPEGIKLNFLDNGEENQFKFEFFFHNIKELNLYIEKLNEIKESLKMKELLTIFNPYGE